MQHAGKMMEEAPQEYAAVREIFIRYRKNNIDLAGSTTFTVFDARQQMMLATHTSVCRPVEDPDRTGAALDRGTSYRVCS